MRTRKVRQGPNRTDPGSFCLPSGRPLAEFALSAGFVASHLWSREARTDKRLPERLVPFGSDESPTGNGVAHRSELG